MNKNSSEKTDAEHGRSLANLCCFLITEPVHDDPFCSAAESYCQEKMPYTQVFLSPIDGIPAVLEKIPNDADLYVYLHGGLQPYSAFLSKTSLDLRPRERCNAMGVVLPVDDLIEMYNLHNDLSVETLSRCRKANMQIPENGRSFGSMTVVGHPRSAAKECENVYDALQQIVAVSFTSQVNRAYDEHRRMRPRSSTMYFTEISIIASHYTFVFDKKRRDLLDTRNNGRIPFNLEQDFQYLGVK
jgi:hypothetical protein